jgi:membrane associated rhomboid family serine protease
VLATLNFIVASKYYRRRWFPVVAALALLALLGTEGKNTDLGAHLFGFISGALLGLITGYFIKHYGHSSRLVNTLFGMLSLLLVIAAWTFAITNSNM